MPQSKILIDTNTYIRLAKAIRPLLSVIFGKPQYCLYILPELNAELGNRKLQTKFPWVDEDEYKENRKKFPSISRAQKKEILNTFEHIWEHVQTELPGPSRVDALYIAYALELQIPVVTDDQDMTDLANVFEVEIKPTLGLLKTMLECNHVDMKLIDGLCGYWRYISDLPANFKFDYDNLFSSP